MENRWKHDSAVITDPDPTRAAEQAKIVGARYGRVVLGPLGTGADDWLRFGTVLHAVKGMYPVVQGSGVWRAKTKLQDGPCGLAGIPSNTTIECMSGVRVVSSIASIDAATGTPYFAQYVLAGAGDTTLAAAASRGAKTIQVHASVPVGSIIRLDSTSNWVLHFYVVKAVSGVADPYTLTLDRPLVRSFANARPVKIVASQPTNITINGNGAVFSNDTANSDRYVEIFGGLRCHVRNFSADLSGGKAALTQFGFDIGSRDCWFEDVKGWGDGSTTAACFAFESSEDCGAIRCRSRGDAVTGFWIVDSDATHLVDCHGTNGTRGAQVCAETTDGCQDVIIDRCKFVGNATAGISIEYSARTHVVDTTCSEHPNPAVGGIYITATSSATKLTRITCDNNYTAGVYSLSPVEIDGYNAIILTGNKALLTQTTGICKCRNFSWTMAADADARRAFQSSSAGVTYLEDGFISVASLNSYGAIPNGGAGDTLHMRNVTMAVEATSYGVRIPNAIKFCKDGELRFSGAGTFLSYQNATPGTTYQGAAPGECAWNVGDICWNNAPAAGATAGWICTVAGSPGTWKAMANLA